MNAQVITLRGSDAGARGVRQASLLARVLGELMLAQVQHATRLHLDAARVLLRHARLPRVHNPMQHDDEWRMAWRGFEICATTADQILGLTREQGRRSSAHLWRLSEKLLAELAQLPQAQVELVRQSFETLHEVQEACAQAAESAQQALLAAVMAQLPVPGREGATLATLATFDAQQERSHA